MKKAKKTVGTKTVTVKLTSAQQKLLEEKTKGVFTAATFTFSTRAVKPPLHKVGCVLDRVARPVKVK